MKGSCSDHDRIGSAFRHVQLAAEVIAPATERLYSHSCDATSHRPKPVRHHYPISYIVMANYRRKPRQWAVWSDDRNLIGQPLVMEGYLARCLDVKRERISNCCLTTEWRLS